MYGNHQAMMFVAVVSILIGITGHLEAELSENHRNELESQIAKDKEQCADAKEKLLKEFEKQLAVVRVQKGASAEMRLQLIAALEVEEQTFETTGCIPFSPRMRSAAKNYMARVSESGRRVAKAYDIAITALTKSKDDDTATEMIRMKDNVPKVVGKWQCQGANFRQGEPFTWTLYSDFSVNRFNDAEDARPKFWSFNGNSLVITNFAPLAPKGGFKDVCNVHPNGQKFDAKNQQGGIYVGERID